ncbi:hypothetical protein ACTZNZ_23765, partial [Klebsiella pneumoniae]
NAYAAGEQYFPQEMAQTRYYHPTNRAPCAMPGITQKINRERKIR